MANSANVDGIGNAIAVKNAGREAKIGAFARSCHRVQSLTGHVTGTLLINAQQRLQRVQGIVGGVNGGMDLQLSDRNPTTKESSVINSSSTLKGLAEEIFAPAKAVMNVLEAVAEMNPAIKVPFEYLVGRTQIR